MRLERGDIFVVKKKPFFLPEPCRAIMTETRGLLVVQFRSRKKWSRRNNPKWIIQDIKIQIKQGGAVHPISALGVLEGTTCRGVMILI